LTIFVDASALIAMIAGEAEGEKLAATIRTDGDPLWSAMSCWEAVVALRKARDISFEEARGEVEAVAAALPLQLVEIGEEERRGALDAHRIYGKGRHPARLNMGDCFAYACAKTAGATLLYKGDDFRHTDLA
jgi:ribonuclease VapC